MQSPGILDPASFVIVPSVAVLDTFKMTDDSGAFLADINDQYIDKFVAHMNERERLTGDLCPLVLGHTSDNYQPEVEAPQIVGYARNYSKGTLGETDRSAAFADFWIYKKDIELVRKHGSRRSCEIWVSRYEADPISLLGATTPCRDLGLLKLSRDSQVKLSAYQQGELMPADALPPADPKESGAAKGKEAVNDQILALLSEILSAVKGGGMSATAPQPDGATPGAQAPGELSDEEYEKLLSQLEPEEGGSPPDEKGKEGEKPVKEGTNCGSAQEIKTPPTGDDQGAKKMERENAELRTRLSRLEITGELKDLALTHDVQIDEALISDLAAQPVDMRARQIERLKKLSRPKVGGPTPIDAALADARPSGTRGKRISSLEERDRIIKLARTKGTTFESVAAEQGYDVG